MKRVIVSLVAVGMLAVGMPSAQAAIVETGRQGRNFEFRTCEEHEYKPGAHCAYTTYDNGDLKIHTENARANVWYEVPRPNGASVLDVDFLVNQVGPCNTAHANVALIGLNPDFASVRVRSGYEGLNIGNCRVERVVVTWQT
jgi:hypothetical protein